MQLAIPPMMYVRIASSERIPMNRTGFSLIEVLVGLAIVVVLAAVVTPNLVGMLDDARVERGVTSLQNLSDAIAAFEEDVKEYPATLTQLTAPVTGDDPNSCGSTFSPGHAQQWAGPYLNRLVPVTGIPIAIGTAQIELTREGDGKAGVLRIAVPQTTEVDAIEINRRIDGDGDPSGGAVHWTATDTEGMVTLYYLTPVKGC